MTIAHAVFKNLSGLFQIGNIFNAKCVVVFICHYQFMPVFIEVVGKDQQIGIQKIIVDDFLMFPFKNFIRIGSNFCFIQINWPGT